MKKKPLLLAMILLSLALCAAPALCQENDYKAPNEVNYEEFDIPNDPDDSLYEEPLQDPYGQEEEYDSGENGSAVSQNQEAEDAGEETPGDDEGQGDESVYGDAADPNSEPEQEYETETYPDEQPLDQGYAPEAPEEPSPEQN